MGVLQNKKVWISAVALVILIVGVLSFFFLRKPTVIKFSQNNNLLIFSNKNYEIAFTEDHGGIAYIKDTRTGKSLTDGNHGGNLWWAFLSDNTTYTSLKADQFSYDWDKKNLQLLLHYKGKLQVDVTTTFAEHNRISMKASVVNNTGGTISSFALPYELNIESNNVQDALLPMLPGAKLRKEFFSENNSYEAQYPGVMFAPYLALRTVNGNLSIYDLNDQSIATMGIGFKNTLDKAGFTGIVHNYKTWIGQQAKWQTPNIVLQVGGDYPDSIMQYRTLAGIDKYTSIKEKLGNEAAQYFGYPFYKTDISALNDANWGKLTTDYVDQLDYNGVIHLVGFQKGGHDENYPDFIPPDPKWGGMESLQSFVKAAHDKGDKIVPYTNFSWWGVHSPTWNNLPNGITLNDVIVNKESGNLIKEDYGPHSGYVIDPNNEFALKRIADEHKKLLEVAGFDGIFEDQWGIRDTPYIFNSLTTKTLNPSNAYTTGLRSYVGSLKNNFYTEDGFDILGSNAVGFMGTNFLWDKLGYRPNTATYTDYYPMIGMLERDKVMLYQHDLASETMTSNQDMLRWNLAMGYHLSADLFNGVTNPWVNITGVFQKYVLSNYADELVKDFKQLTPTITETDFDSYRVIANWDTKNPYKVDENTTIAPGGYDVVGNDGKVRAGLYTRLNGFDLDPDDHDIIMVREESGIKIFQPYGADTTIQLDKGNWKHAAAAAFTADGTKVADLPVVESDKNIKVDFIARINDTKVAYIQLNDSNKPSDVTNVPFHKEKLRVNFAAEKPVVTTTNTSSEYPGKNAVDGDPFTYWESISKKFPQSITVDLSTERSVNEVVLKLPPRSAWKKRVQELKVLGSDDGKTYAKIIPPKEYTFDPNQDNTVTIDFDPVKTRYLQITIKSNTGWPAAQLSEIEVYGQAQ